MFTFACEVVSTTSTSIQMEPKYEGKEVDGRSFKDGLASDDAEVDREWKHLASSESKDLSPHPTTRHPQGSLISQGFKMSVFP